jgi:hypothetical protein
MSFYRIPAMGKRKCKSKDELQSKYSCFWNGHDEWVAACFVYKPGISVSVANKGAIDR